MMTKLTTKTRLALRRFAMATAGVAIIEFALLAPIMMLMAFGTMEVTNAVLAHKRFQRATAMVADLVSREQNLGDTTQQSTDALAGIVAAAEFAMWPLDTSQLKIGVMAVHANINNAANTTVRWSYAHNGASVTNCPAPKALPQNGMIVAGNYAIVVEGQYTGTPLLAGLSSYLHRAYNTGTYKSTMINSPRNNCVAYGGRNCQQMAAACP
jgi:Flp pilus assembly protein TadG